MTDFIVPDPHRLDGEEPRICLVCGRVVDYWTNPVDAGYRHSIASADLDELDHPVIAVRASEAPGQMRARCDFCYSDETAFTVPAQTFQLPGSPSVSVEDWAACEECGRAIEHNDWNTVFRRAKVSFEAREGPVGEHVERNLKGMHRALRKNMTGPIYRGQPR